jgi:hypothetical protein
VVLTAGAVMTWVCAPPSDQDVKPYEEPLSTCGDGALIVLLEPTITVTENGVVACVPLGLTGLGFVVEAGRRPASSRVRSSSVTRAHI